MIIFFDVCAARTHTASRMDEVTFSCNIWTVSVLNSCCSLHCYYKS